MALIIVGSYLIDISTNQQICMFSDTICDGADIWIYWSSDPLMVALRNNTGYHILLHIDRLLLYILVLII